MKILIAAMYGTLILTACTPKSTRIESDSIFHFTEDRNATELEQDPVYRELGLEKLNQYLVKKTTNSANVNLDILRGFQGMSIPGMISVMALGAKEKQVGIEIPDPFFPGLPSNEIVTEAVMEAALNHYLEEEGIYLTKAEFEAVIRLLKTGEFYRDIDAVSLALRSMVNEAPGTIVGDLKELPKDPLHILNGIREDLKTDPVSLLDFIKNSSGTNSRATPGGGSNIGETPRVGTNTMKEIYRNQSTRLVVQTFRELIHPDNETVRLAIIVFARINGIRINQGDLDALREGLDPDDPNLGIFIARGFERIQDYYMEGGSGSILDALKGMH